MKLSQTGSPHIRGDDSTGRIMLDVALALLPAVAAGTFFFGVRALLVILVSVVSAMMAEWLFYRLQRRSAPLEDHSALVTGLLLALTLPVSVPYWLVCFGSTFAVIFAKELCGGLGQNIFNPALAARAFMLLLWPAWMVRYPAPNESVPALGSTIDVITAATPLHHMQIPALPEISLGEMFVGSIGGSIGETSTLALLLGAGYLLYRKVIALRIPMSYLLTVALATLSFSKTEQPIAWMVYSLLGGGVVLGACFMATDYASSPVTPRGQVLYGIGCGVLTVFFRYEGLFPEGVTYAILLMNACVWWIERITAPKRFGSRKVSG